MHVSVDGSCIMVCVFQSVNGPCIYGMHVSENGPCIYGTHVPVVGRCIYGTHVPVDGP